MRSRWMRLVIMFGMLATGAMDAQQTASVMPSQTQSAQPGALVPPGSAVAAVPDLAAEPLITLAAVGDVMIGSSFPDESSLPPNDGKDLMASFAPLLRAADVTFGNLEGPMLEGGVSTKCPNVLQADGSLQPKANCFAFRVPTRYAEDLRSAGFTVMSVANNHAGDFGEGGRASTRNVLGSMGIQYVGSDRGQYATTVVEVRGTRIGFVGFAFNEVSPNLNDVEEARRMVRALKRRADLVVVSFHGGGEGVNFQHVPPAGTHEIFLGEDRGDEREFAHAVIDAGADVVLGHGPHVLRGMEVYQGRLIVYSMGNFCTYGMFGLKAETGLTAMFMLNVDTEGRFVNGRLFPGRQVKPGGPVRDATGEAVRIVRGLSVADFGAGAPQIADDGSFVP